MDPCYRYRTRKKGVTTKSSEIFRVCRAHAAAAESESEQTFASCDQQPCALPTYSKLWNDHEEILRDRETIEARRSSRDPNDRIRFTEG
ncbi:unnamed protein product [Plutella xylostella]|uniref:(diamondback moth) hypothetical protein n=1 Tax=Plutella xylostella TaxID=51655 RepID=A0A8S4G3V7_PLUXY|nr:unnamed protein product [Plutella xylostella]